MFIKGAIFDLDGTLLDSMKIWETVGEDYLLSLGIRPRENLAETFKAMSLSQSAAYYQKNYGIKKSEEEIIRGVNNIIETFYLEKAQLKEGVRELLEVFEENDIEMCIATTSERYLVEGALNRCGVLGYFTKIFTCREVGAGKDQPFIYEKALQELGTTKKDTLVFEDAIHAVRTAKKAGFTVVGVYDSSEMNQEDIRNLSDYYIKTAADWGHHFLSL